MQCEGDTTLKLPDWYERQAREYIATLWSSRSTPAEILAMTVRQRQAECLLQQIRMGHRRDVSTESEIRTAVQQTTVAAHVRVAPAHTTRARLPSIISMGNKYRPPPAFGARSAALHAGAAGQPDRVPAFQHASYS